ncbi:MAG: conserved rane protein of unknown function [Candidatus Saccharibacteria bacterium]|nr:conserved rane protein of unknown function [Candidatus Saccharibacteria bacterium]
MRIFSPSSKPISITPETMVKGIAIAIGAYLLLKFVGNVAYQLQLVAIAAFLALALNPAVTWITHRLKSRSRVRATATAYVMVLTILISFIALIVPPLVNQTTEFIREVPQTINNIKTDDSPLADTVRRYNLESQVDRVRDDFGHRIGDLTGPVFTTVGRVGGAIISIITVLVLTFMMLVEGPLWYKRFMALQDPGKREHRKKLAHKMYRVVTSYVNGQVLIAAIAAAFALVALLIGSTIFNVSVNPVALAGIVFLFGLIPMFGNILAATIVVLVSLLSSVPLALVMAAFFLVYQQVENATLQPYIQSKGSQLTPLTVFIAALLGVGLGGIMGALAAIPIAGCIRVLVDDKLKTKMADLHAIDEAPLDRK